MEGCFDSVLCINVLEYVEDPVAVVRSLRGTLKAGGVLVMLVPNGPGLFGSLDRSLGHKRRYRTDDAYRLLEQQGFGVERVYSFNKTGTAPWWIYSRLLGSRRINKPVLKVFDKSVWLLSRLDRWMPWPGLSLILVARNGTASPPPAADSARRRTAVPHASMPNAD